MRNRDRLAVHFIMIDPLCTCEIVSTKAYYGFYFCSPASEKLKFPNQFFHYGEIFSQRWFGFLSQTSPIAFFLISSPNFS